MIDLCTRLINGDSRLVGFYVGTMAVGRLTATPYYREPNTIGRWDATVSTGLLNFFTAEEAAFITQTITDAATMRNITMRMKL